MKLMRTNLIIAGLALLILSIPAIAQDKKVEFLTGLAISYNEHTGNDYLPGDTIVDYSNASTYIRIPHPPYYYHNNVSYRITPVSMRIYPLKKRMLYSDFQLIFENNREISTTPKDSIVYYEPYYLPHGAIYPIQKNVGHKSVYFGGFVGCKWGRFSAEFGGKLLLVSWSRTIAEYYDTGIKKYSGNEFIIFNSSESYLKLIQPAASILYDVSESLSMNLTVYPYDFNYFAFSLGVAKTL